MPLVARTISARTSSVGALVLLHGLGSHEGALLELAGEVPPALDVVGLRAPLDYGDGFAWFEIGWTAAGVEINLDQARESLDLLLAELHRLQAVHGRLLLGGFSQGAMMTLSAVMREPTLVSGCLLMSGAPVPADVVTPPVTGLGGLPAMVQHGRMDPVLPVELGRQAAASLRAAGAAVEYHEYDMAHSVSPESLDDAMAWVDRTIAQTSK